MFATALIVFREVLEAALIIGIVAAATRGVPQRGRWLGAGLLLGLAGAGLLAAGTESIARLASGLGQEIFNAGILGVAVIMLAWHNIWMASHGKQLASNARGVGQAVRDGLQECSVLMVLVGLAVLREGAETVLFLYGVAASGGSDNNTMLLGGVIGIAGGTAIGVAMYQGLLRIPLRWFFSATALLVLLLAAGMAAQATGFLIQADLLPSLADPLWDTSSLLDDHSISGKLLHGLVGYTARPAGMQVIAYIAVAVLIAFGMRWVNHGGRAHSPSPSV
ncbi:MAG: iron permease [Burkholderiaceae bacterium]|nr:MAG: iron permease [Burkholderiaceae bacterium]